MPRTAWGSEITYSFEIEGTFAWDAAPYYYSPVWFSDNSLAALKDVNIVRWFRPPTFSNPEWSAKSLKECAREVVNFLRGGGKFEGLIGTALAPPWIELITEDLSPMTWELRSRAAGDAHVNSIDVLFNQITTVFDALSLSNRTTQIHIVFGEPQGAEKARHYRMLIGIWRLLNDYATWKSVASDRKPHAFVQKFVGALPAGLEQKAEETITDAFKAGEGRQRVATLAH